MSSLVPMEMLKGGALAKEDQFDETMKSSSFLPRLQLFGGTSDAVKEEKVRQGVFGVVESKDNINDLGKEVNCLPLAWRFKAMMIADGEVISSYDSTSPQFEKIKLDSDTQDSGCMWGAEFLLWLPDIGFVTYFLSSKSSRREAKPLRGLIGQAATLKVELVATKKFKWHAPKVTACSAPFSTLPDMDKMKKELERFHNPETGPKTESAPETTDSRER